MVKYTTKDIIEPKSGSEVYTDSYWLCEAGDPSKALFHNDRPQCNKDKRISEWVLNGAYKGHDNLQIVFVQTAFVPRLD